jgi:hypothetical protein
VKICVRYKCDIDADVSVGVDVGVGFRGLRFQRFKSSRVQGFRGLELGLWLVEWWLVE